VLDLVHQQEDKYSYKKGFQEHNHLLTK